MALEDSFDFKYHDNHGGAMHSSRIEPDNAMTDTYAVDFMLRLLHVAF